MRMRIAALAAGFIAVLVVPFAVAALEPGRAATKPTDSTALATLLTDPYAEAPMHVALVQGFTTLDDML